MKYGKNMVKIWQKYIKYVNNINEMNFSMKIIKNN